MGKYGKKVSLLVMVTMMVSVLGGCGKSASSESSAASSAAKSVKVAVVCKALNSDYWNFVKAGAMDAGKALGVEVEVLGPNAETDIAGQTSMMEDQIVKGVSALVVAPSQPSAAIATFDKADAAKIPVILIDSDAKWDKKKSFVGTGNLNGGKVAGEFLASKLSKGDEVVIIRGALGDATHDDRTNGAKTALDAAEIKVVDIQPANSDRNMALTVMTNLLQRDPNIKGVFATSDDMSMGAQRAVQTANRKDILVVGFDGSPDALKSIKAGELTGSVAQSPYNIGKDGVEQAVKAVKGEKVDARVDTGTTMITKDNVQQAMDEQAKILSKVK
jgi:ribose transport system substrate-binding protein